MKRILLLLLLTSFGLSKISSAQNDGVITAEKKSPVLFTYGDHQAKLDEFKRQFYKNNPVESITKDTARYYLDLFINKMEKYQHNPRTTRGNENTELNNNKK